MTAFRKILDWFKYERLGNYPPLAAFDRATALKRLQAYEREERQALPPWIRMLWFPISMLPLLVLVLAYCNLLPEEIAALVFVVLMAPIHILQYLLHRRIRRRVEIKVAAELGGGRL